MAHQVVQNPSPKVVVVVVLVVVLPHKHTGILKGCGGGVEASEVKSNNRR